MYLQSLMIGYVNTDKTLFYGSLRVDFPIFGNSGIFLHSFHLMLKISDEERTKMHGTCEPVS